MASAAKAAKSAAVDVDLYELKFRGGCSDGVRLSDERYPEGSRLIEDGHQRKREWLMKLASMFRDQVGLDKEKVYFFKDFPENYHLRMKPRGAAKGKAEGEVYLYGWPYFEGRPKSFRSPKDFFPHLLWLSTSSRDFRACSCGLCTQKAQEQASRMQRSNQPAAVENARPPVADMPQTAPAVVPSQARRPELFRAGEVLWYQLGNAWRLGIILEVADLETPTGARWTIRPLAHNYFQAAQDVAKSEKEVRPYLAFSVPSINPALAPTIGDKSMEEIDWRTMQQQITGGDRQKQESLSLEASKVAVTTVDHSYSTFNSRRREAANPNSFVNEHVGGVFFGCERIEMGDGVRVSLPPEEQERYGPGQFVLLIEGIYVTGPSSGDLAFHGDICCLKQIPPNHSAPPLIPLPHAMEEEAAFWNRVKARPGVNWEWVWKRKATMWERNVRGRFYPTPRLRQLINPAQFEQDIQTGRIESVQAYLNNRGSSKGRYIGRKKNRMETVRSALPLGSQTLSFGPDVVEEH